MLKKKERSTMATLAEDTANAVKPKADLARDKLSTATDQARVTVAETVVPALQEAAEKIGPALQEAKEKMAPMAEQAIAETKAKGRRAAEKAGLAEEPKKSHKLRNFLILLGLGGVAAFVYTKITGRQADPAWTESHESERSARHIAAVSDTGAAAGPVDGSDTAPTAPLPSEETVESPVPTTPDEPLEKKDLT